MTDIDVLIGVIRMHNMAFSSPTDNRRSIFSRKGIGEDQKTIDWSILQNSQPVSNLVFVKNLDSMDARLACVVDLECRMLNWRP